MLSFLAWERKNKHQTATPFKCVLSCSSSPRPPSPPFSDRELLRLQTAPTPTPSPGQADNGPENPTPPRPLPAAPRGLKIGKHKAIFNVLFVYQLRLWPEKQYHLWEVALIFFNLLRQSHIFATFRKAKKATLSKGDLFPGSPFCPSGMLSQGCLGKQPLLLCTGHQQARSRAPRMEWKAQGSPRRASETGGSKGVGVSERDIWRIREDRIFLW